jgi:hypothetical protein
MPQVSRHLCTTCVGFSYLCILFLLFYSPCLSADDTVVTSDLICPYSVLFFYSTLIDFTNYEAASWNCLNPQGDRLEKPVQELICLIREELKNFPFL